MSRAVVQYLEQQQAQAAPALQPQWEELGRLYARRLWHQLTLSLETFVRNEAFQQGTGLIDLYQNLIKDIEDRINPLSLVTLVLFVIRQMNSAPDAIAFLQPLSEKVKYDKEATICIQTAIANLKIETGALDEAEELLATCNKELDTLDTVTAVHANYYKAAANFNKLKGDFAAYYVSALKYLGCVDAEKDLLPADQVVLAFDLSLAALLGTGIYNFGELLAHPILNSLKNTAQAWLIDLLFAFNAGNIDKFKDLAQQWRGQDDLAAAEAFLLEKITLLALMELVFKRAANQRDVAFADIAIETRTDVNGVEVLVMRAMALGLVRGSLDQVKQVASLNWVQPRVLDSTQLSSMKQRLQDWTASVQQTATAMTTLTPELFA